ncbi:possible hydrolase [Thermobifida fusca YX]|uniref:Hydrolase n=2 Tax=Thermobifida fusca TaxID=2021 RepID=A0A9P2WQR8_THEFU|nr:MBL fold metallo-hydrolase [Thermobifida fusca]AAZ56120.1 possible hydrolase [Thermobifida fusca YX]EOR70848.1 hydrolase [Thermobifida fusca TM51]QOS60594.1 MBL fold metallo-hydrolase [Thermobifida fusca]
MLIADFPAGPLAANCYVVAPEAGAECVIVDPGQQATEGVARLLDEYRLTPVAVLLTHGHFDHVWSAEEVCQTHDIAAYAHAADRPLLSDPARGVDPGLAAQLAALFGNEQLREPKQVVEVTDGQVLQLAGLEITVAHAPGHTPGSVVYALPPTEDTPEVLFTGDLLFAGSIGRTDFPGGDHAAIMRSLSRVCLSRGDDTVVLPGHGPRTTIGRERATNPFLRGL